MKTALEEYPSHVTVTVTDVDPALEPQMLGFEFTPIGGGFERNFEVGPPDLMAVLGRFQESIEPMVRQLAGWDSVPWQSALNRFIGIAGSSIDWWLVGSAALAVRGIDIEPRDIDIVVSEQDFSRTNEMFEQFIVEPPQESEEFIARFFCRAFIEARIEWVAGVYEWVDSPEPSDFGPFAGSQSQVISWEGSEVRVPPLSLQLASSKRRGLVDRALLIEQSLKAAK